MDTRKADIMTEGQMLRYALVEFEVEGHKPYGLVFRTTGGASGFVDKADISDSPISPEDWPLIGRRLTGVVLGTTRSGQIRATTRASDIALAAGVNDPERALIEWARIRDKGFVDSSDRDVFFASPEAAFVLNWALRQRDFTTDRERATEVLSDAPERLRAAVRGMPPDPS